MNMQEAVVSVLSKYATLSGRAPRSEYWWFALANLLVYIALAIIDRVILRFENGGLATVYSLAVFVPYLAVAVRRLHDINKSGWNLLWSFLPIIGTILLIYWFCQRGNIIDNDYGPDPLDGYDY